MKIKKLRRTTQIFTLIAIFIIPIINLLEIYFIKGTFYSMDIGDLAISDPLAIFQILFSSKIFNITMLASILIPVLVMLLLGRIWCSFFCPYYTIVEFLAWIRKKLKFKNIKPIYKKGNPSRSNTIRFLFLISGLVLTGIAGIPILNLILTHGIISSQALILVKFGYLTFEIVFVILLLLIEFFLIDKFWCKYLCPSGTLLSLFKFKKGLRIKKLVNECSNCNKCITVCPMGLDPQTEGDNILCHNCGDCIDICPDNKKTETLKFKI